MIETSICSRSTTDKSFVRVRIAGEREVIFGDVLVRVDPNFSIAIHLDTDEGNAAGIETGAQGLSTASRTGADGARTAACERDSM